MAELETLLSVAIVASVAINAITCIYVLRRFQPLPPRTDITEVAQESEDEEESGEEEGHGEDAVNPLKAQIQARRAQLIRELEEERGSRVITLIHRKEPWSADEDEPEIVLEESETILQQVRETP